MRNKLVESLNRIFEDENCPMTTEAVGRIADRLIAEGFGLVADREMDGRTGPCKVGDSVFVLYYNEENGKTEIDEMTVNEVSGRRFWVEGDDGFDFRADEIGTNVFLTREDAEAFVKSPEYLNQRVSFVKLLNVSDETKRELLVAGFEAGQEYRESGTERYLKLTARGPFDVWKFDVFDNSHEYMYSETAFGGRLANEILNGEIVPAVDVQKGLDEVIRSCEGMSKKNEKGAVAREVREREGSGASR